jgi:hypothetical protein
MKYKIIKGGINHLGSIEVEVNAQVELGWFPIGELKHATSEGQTVFYQQMEYVGKEEPKRLLNPRPSYSAQSPYQPRRLPGR